MGRGLGGRGVRIRRGSRGSDLVFGARGDMGHAEIIGWRLGDHCIRSKRKGFCYLPSLLMLKGARRICT